MSASATGGSGARVTLAFRYRGREGAAAQHGPPYLALLLRRGQDIHLLEIVAVAEGTTALPIRWPPNELS